MTLAGILYAAWGGFLGLLLGFGNAFLRQYFAIRLLKTDKKKAVAFVSIFSVIRLAVILLVIYILITYVSKVMALGTLAGLVIHTIVMTIKYTKTRNKLKEIKDKG
ncbi:MAG: hypothetical protein A2452_07635 [Candidatus Firestonebacteria bacterium RIFOXYC2_FULL_39_67]|nr:MAG: hypothetical protein A2536_01470 [Candidatus Firestonebacteria bacterium RIFOXYD2_FULL_39_29]OGF52971.1 MAG: hypothetical protein A2497_00220 [Candidatus Firestonebacteria bacterium RifOxyC12_full_39_7]OGF55523.1 MAG: hypothetical protein A2452_07635 [Candidatus Firestonebacteria bacterium RIFOXYC2_FULL_39_67]